MSFTISKQIFTAGVVFLILALIFATQEGIRYSTILIIVVSILSMIYGLYYWNRE